MNVGDASNNADDRANDEADESVDGDGTPDNADTIDADVLDILTQIQTNEFLDLELTASDNPEQIPSAESESPPEDLPNPLEPGSSDMQPLVVIERFPHGNAGAPIDGMQGYSIYESSQGALDGSVWAPFQSESDWRIAHWAKTNKLSSSALSDLFAIPDVRPTLFFAPASLNEV